MDDRSIRVVLADDAQVSNAVESLLERSSVETSLASVPLSRLSVSPLNVRRKALSGIEGLADSILAKGLLQNLVAHPAKGSRGKNPKLCVCAGQRRLAALQLLADQGKINPDMNIPVKVLTEAEAVAASLIENESREPMLGYAPQVSCCSPCHSFVIGSPQSGEGVSLTRARASLPWLALPGGSCP